MNALDRWLFTGLDGIYQGETFQPRKSLALGCAVWGADYCQRFSEWCVPSLLEPHNAHALASSNSRVVIATPKNELRRLFHAVRLLEQAGIEVQILDIPLDVMADVGFEPNGQYWLLGVAQALLVRLAARLGMAWHMLMPDHCYARGYFTNLFRLGRKYNAIAHNTISADLTTAAPELRAFLAQGHLAIQPERLGDIGWRHLHKQMRGFTMKVGQKTWPNSHYFLWQGRDRLWIFSPHANVAWMSNELCKRAPVVKPATIDSQLPKVMPYGAYVPELADEMTLIELSDDNKPAPPRVSLEQCLTCCAMSVELRSEYMPWFKLPSTVPIPEQRRYTTAAAVQKQQTAMQGLIAGAIERIKAKAGGKETIFTYDALPLVKS